MKKISSAHRDPSSGSRLAARTVSHCPANGFWIPEGQPGQAVFVFEGSIMPAGSSGATVWLLDKTISGPPAYPLPGPQRSYAMARSLAG
ncbi:hypothetical protein [Pseudarthrobacter sp. CCNWLW207]|uniref:hypothetical protein n=1 Tax=Pseudarthrobacter sp. CCNWLW207 TaxID=3127468 RepID=UPI003076C970